MGPLTSSEIYKELWNNRLTTLALDDKGPIQDLNLLAAILQKGNTSLTSLSLNGLNVPSLSLVKFVEALKVNKGLQSLTLNHIQMAAPELANLSEALKENKTLQHLAIQNAGLTDDSLKILSPGLIQNTSLNTLDLSDNAIQAQKGVLSAMVAQHPSLTALHLGHNNIADESVLALANSISLHKTLKLLALSTEQLSVETITILVGCLRANKGNLVHIDKPTVPHDKMPILQPQRT